MYRLKKALCVSTLIFASPMFIFGGQATAQEVQTVNVQTSNLNSTQKEMMQYVSIHEDGLKIRFDEERAKAEGASEDAMRSGEILNALSASMQDNQSRLGEGKIWGNWCGKGHSGPGAPVDLLDTACMHHDQCYAARGYGTCSCDDDLIAEINRNYPRMHTTEKWAANAVVAYFLARKKLQCS